MGTPPFCSSHKLLNLTLCYLFPNGGSIAGFVS